MIFVSYYTKNTPYEEVMETHIHASFHKWNLPHDIEGIKDLGNWSKNTHYKAKFIKKMMLKHKEPIIFLDADATIERYPKLFEHLKDYDVAYHKLDWHKFWRNEEGNPKRETLSGTLYFNYNKSSLTFLDEWILLNQASANWEQRNMEKLMEKWINKIKFYDLPIEYIAIIKRNGKVPDYIKEPVILHHQVSRRYRK